MVDQRGKVHHLLGHEQEKMAQLWRQVYRGLSLEQTHEPLPQHGAMAGCSHTEFYEKTPGQR